MKSINDIYLESSAISYLAARPADDDLIRGKQKLTRKWWDERHSFRMFISETVLEEIQRGDSEAAEKRFDAVKGIEILQPTEDVVNLAKAILHSGAVPPKSILDAMHIAYAAVYEMDYLITWNQKHIASDTKKEHIRIICEEHGLHSPRLMTPETHLILLETQHNVDI